ncbi:MAG: DUF1320 domain-containing protein [Spirochaetales bacterium]|nr:DUF1320 domain-containing protein [Spirochaetales bacterium]
MAYCTKTDLETAFGVENIQGWSRLVPGTVDRAIKDAQAEIDGFLFSGGYAVPLNPVPDNITKYCIDLAAVNLLTGVGVNKDDAGEEAILERARVARRYLGKVAEGKFRIPGYGKDGEVVTPPAGSVQVRTDTKLDWSGY